MKLQYIGHRDIYPVVLGSHRYIFSPRNAFILTVPDSDARWILQMASHEFKVMSDDAVAPSETVTAEEEPVVLSVPKRRGRPRKNA